MAPFWLFTLLFAAISLGAPSSVEDKPCTLRHRGKFYDLNPLRTSKDYELKTSAGYEMVMNVCKGVSRETWGLKGVEDPGAVMGFVRRDHGDFSIGSINTTLTPSASSSVSNPNLQLTLTKGSTCKSSNQRATTSIEFICDTGVFDTGRPRLVASLPPFDEDNACAFFIEWRTHYACPIQERGSFFSFLSSLIILLLIVLLLYLSLGTLYNRYVLQLSGWDQVPQFSFASAKYHLQGGVEWFRECMERGYEGGQGGRVTLGRGSGGFGNTTTGDGSFHLPSSRDQVNPASHQASVSTGKTPAFNADNGGNGGFVRPTGTRRPETNPVSHQSQSMAATQPPPQTASSSNEPAPPVKKAEEKGSKEEKEFMLGDDSDGEEDIATGSSAPASAATATAAAVETEAPAATGT